MKALLGSLAIIATTFALVGNAEATCNCNQDGQDNGCIYVFEPAVGNCEVVDYNGGPAEGQEYMIENGFIFNTDESYDLYLRCSFAVGSRVGDATMANLDQLYFFFKPNGSSQDIFIFVQAVNIGYRWESFIGNSYIDNTTATYVTKSYGWLDISASYQIITVEITLPEVYNGSYTSFNSLRLCYDPD